MKDGQKPQSIADDTSCLMKFTSAQSYTQSGKFQLAYTACRNFIESCYNEKDSWRAFGIMDNANSNRLPDTVGKNPEFREWLKKVLYFNTVDRNYYCEDVRAIISTYLGFDKADGADVNAAARLIHYFIDSTDCNSLDSILLETLRYRRGHQYELWQDTVKDPSATPYDTSMPSIDDLDLSIIRKGQYSVPTYNAVETIHDVLATPNPFDNQLALEYSIDDNVVLNIEILDVLGREITRTDRKMYTKGRQRYTFNTATWKSGTYFAKISTSHGEVKMVKISKE
jgi:hypothetical protein